MLYPAIAVVYLRLFLPLVLKNKYSYIYDELTSLIVICIILTMGLVFAFKKWTSKKVLFSSGFELPLGLFFLASCLSLIHSVYFAGSFLYMLTLTSYGLYFYILIDLFKERKSRRLFLVSLIIASAAVAIYAMWEWFQPASAYLHGTDRFVPIKLSYRRVGSVFDAPNVLAGFCLLILPILGGLWVLAQKSWQKIGTLFLIVMFLIVFAMTLSLLCSLNMIIVTVIFAPWVMKSWFNKSLDWRFYAVVALIAVSVFGLIGLMRQDFAIQARAEYLTAAWQLIRQYAILGSGTDTFKFLSAAYTTGNSYSGYVHNSYVQIWLEMGVLGVIAIGIFLVRFVGKVKQAFVSEVSQSSRIMLMALAWGLGAFYLDNLTNFTLLSFDVSLFSWIALSGLCSLLKTEQLSSMSTSKTAEIIAAVLVMGFLLVQSSFWLLASLNYQQGMTALDRREYLVSYEWLEKARKWNDSNQFYPAGQALTYLRVYGLAHDRQFLNKAEDKFLEAVKRCPTYYLNYVMLSKIAKEQKDNVKLKRYLKEVAVLCPTRYQTLKGELCAQGEAIDKHSIGC